MKKAIVVLFLYSLSASGQTIIFSDNFEQKATDSCWRIVTGNWRIGDVSELRIAPAEGGYRYMLCSGGQGYTGAHLIQLTVDLPASLQSQKIKLSFYYYILGYLIATVQIHKDDPGGPQGLPDVNQTWLFSTCSLFEKYSNVV